VGCGFDAVAVLLLPFLSSFMPYFPCCCECNIRP
jgi:hypothetical protein